MQDAVKSRIMSMKIQPEKAAARVLFEMVQQIDEYEEDEEVEEETIDIAEESFNTFLNSCLGTKVDFQDPRDH